MARMTAGHVTSLSSISPVHLDCSGGEVVARIEAGGVRLSLAELRELKDGEVVELDESADQAISLFVGERRVAIGELVVIDGHYGIRITEVFAS